MNRLSARLPPRHAEVLLWPRRAWLPRIMAQMWAVNDKTEFFSPPALSGRCLKTTAATSSPALTRTTAPRPVRSTTAAPPTGPTRTTAPTAFWRGARILTSTDRWHHHTGATLQPPYISLCVCVCVCGRDTNNVARLALESLIDFCGCSFVISLSLYRFLIFIYIFASNCTRNIQVRHTLCLANQRKHSTLWCPHATLTYSSLAYWGCESSYVCVILCYLFFINTFADGSRTYGLLRCQC